MKKKTKKTAKKRAVKKTSLFSKISKALKPKKAKINKLSLAQLAYLETLETQANAAPSGATFGGSAMVKIKGKNTVVNFATKKDVLDLITKIRVGEASLVF